MLLSKKTGSLRSSSEALIYFVSISVRAVNFLRRKPMCKKPFEGIGVTVPSIRLAASSIFSSILAALNVSTFVTSPSKLLVALNEASAFVAGSSPCIAAISIPRAIFLAKPSLNALRVESLVASDALRNSSDTLSDR